MTRGRWRRAARLLAAASSASALDLSVVVCGRNDGHGASITGDFVTRLRNALLSFLFGLCQRAHRVRAEVLLVEWRPPNTTRRLPALLQEWVGEDFARQAAEFRCDARFFPGLRVVTVSDAMADEALRAAGLPPKGGMLEWHCKSVGIRRSRGDLVLTANADDLPSGALLDFVAHARHLRRDTFYLAQTVTNVALTLGTLAHPFYMVHAGLARQAAAFAEQEAQELLGQSRPEVAFSRARDFCGRPADFWQSARRETEAMWRAYDRDCGVRVNFSEHRSRRTPENFYDLYVGDFMLASRVAWFRIGGAPMQLQSIAIDHIVSCRFTAHGLRQVVLLAPCFNLHQNHPPSMRTRRTRRDASSDWHEGLTLTERCRHPFRSVLSEHGARRRAWGFPGSSFPEVRVSVSPGAPAAGAPAAGASGGGAL